MNGEKEKEKEKEQRSESIRLPHASKKASKTFIYL